MTISIKLLITLYLALGLCGLAGCAIAWDIDWLAGALIGIIFGLGMLVNHYAEKKEDC